MDIYLDILMVLNFAIDFFLLMGANRLCGYPPGTKRAALGAALGSVYSAVCLIPGFRFLGNLFWRGIFLLMMGVIAYGVRPSALRRSIVFAFLSMSLGGVALGLGRGGFWGLVASAAVVFALCALGFREKLGKVSYIPVELCYGSRRMKLTALMDTGNTLRDPVTGSEVLVVDSHVAQQITGLTQTQLSRPVESMGAIPGLRLISYSAVGQPGGLLLALRVPDVKIGKWQGSRLVAFAPNGLSADGTYQALTGGSL